MGVFLKQGLCALENKISEMRYRHYLISDAIALMQSDKSLGGFNLVQLLLEDNSNYQTISAQYDRYTYGAMLKFYASRGSS